MEFVLKMAGLHMGDGDAKVNWLKVADHLEDFVDSAAGQLEENIRFFLEFPPQKQVVRGNSLAFQRAAASTGSKAGDLLVYLRRVRNNLFHGGKTRGQDLAPTDRDKKLLRRGLTIANAIIDEFS